MSLLRKPPLVHKSLRSLPQLGLQTQQMRQLFSEYGEEAQAITDKQMQLVKDYAPEKKMVPWAAVGPVQFPEELTPLQMKCKKGAKFREGGEKWVVLGLEWDVAMEDYCLFYCRQSHRRNIKLLSDDEEGKAEVEHTPFKTVYQVKKGQEVVQQAGLADAPAPHTFEITWE